MDPNSPTGRWLGVYTALGVLGVLGNMLAAWVIFIVVITKTGIYFHSMLVKTVSGAPMPFFNMVDQGVSVNRFSQDMQLIDMELPACVLAAATAIASVVGQAVIIGVTARYIAITFPFILCIFYVIQKFYLRTSRQMRFLDIEYKAPFYSQTIGTLDGLASIRAFRFEAGILDAMCRSLTDSQRPVNPLSCLQQWLQFTGDMTVAVLAITLIVVATTLREQIGVGFLGLALTNVVSFGSTVQMLLVAWVQLEISIGAVARVKRFTSSIGAEAHDHSATGSGPPEYWPSRGEIVFSNVSASYPATGRVLHDINIKIPAGSRVGVCRRTGSGKSSLASALFKLVDINRCFTLIDDVDIATVPHDVLRDAIVGVPQDFLALDETLRLNVDPHSVKTNEELIAILEKIKLWMQLLAFARAMCHNREILVLDEVSSR